MVWMALQVVLVIAICVAVDGANHFLNLSQNPRFRFIRGLSFGCVSGILSAHSLLMAKSAVELVIKTVVDGKNQFVHWQAWVIVLALITLALTQLYYLHRGLKLVSTSVLYPLIFCIYNIIAILDGLIYFDQTEFISPLRGCLITLGTVILLSGVLALSWRLSDEQHTPGVGQSSLAPGLGMVDDTDGEEEEEELLLSSTRDEENVPAANYKYNTFDNREGNIARRSRPDPLPLGRPPTISRRKTSFAQPWAERREIWGVLDDDEVPYSPMPNTGRLRSKTLPINDTSLLISHQRRGLGSPFTPTGRPGSGDRPPRSANSDFVRLRRKSTGFPGFTARRTARRKSVGGGGLQGAVGGISRWWRSKNISFNNNTNTSNNNAAGEPSPQPAFPEYRDDGDVAAVSPALDRYRDDPSASQQDSPPTRDEVVTGKKRRDDSAV